MEADSGGGDAAADAPPTAPPSALDTLLATHGGPEEAAAALLDALVAGRFADEARPARERRRCAAARALGR